ncbi:Elongator subunit elp2 [Blastocladiella emersonii ATCC 22665]|nr:Elongator subunit elp2 [Blastocladiella emersonii ATCC 22665]
MPPRKQQQPPKPTPSGSLDGSPLAVHVTPRLLSAGGSRQPQGAVWSADGAYAYVSNRQVLVCPPSTSHNPKSALAVCPTSPLVGHTDAIRALVALGDRWLVTGARDTTVRVWDRASGECAAVLTGHNAGIYALAALESAENGRRWIVSGDVQGNVKVWHSFGETPFAVAQEWHHRRYAVALALTCVRAPAALGGAETLVLAVGTADSMLHVYLLDGGAGEFAHALALPGHDNWVSSLDLVTVTEAHAASPDATGLHAGDVLLASGSQDRFIRVWRFTFSDAHLGEAIAPTSAGDGDEDAQFAAMLASLQEGQLSTKAHAIPFPLSPRPLHVYLDSVLLGHDEWVYSVAWSPSTAPGPLRLASASADKSVLVWSLADGVWTSEARVGELGGSVLSLHCVRWRPDARALAANGYTGGVHVWEEDRETRRWEPRVAVGGHHAAVRGVTWDPSSQIVVTTSADQTTRVFAPWPVGEGDGKWHEWARPQIHGYDLQCLAFVDQFTLVSGADEKIVRVFGVPSSLVETLAAVGAVAEGSWDPARAVAAAANLPALGLSNKAVSAAPALTADDETTTAVNGTSPDYLERQSYSATSASLTSLPSTTPPLEEHLLQHTLWPELDKLYGHAYELVSVASNARVVATACRATLADHAVVRMYAADGWRELPALAYHALTVTTLKFSGCGTRLLSAGRDRAWALWRESPDNGEWTLAAARDKAHARIVWDAAWGPGDAYFVTGSRDKTVKVWTVLGDDQVTLAATLAMDHPVHAVAVAAVPAGNALAGSLLAVGLENGAVHVFRALAGAEAAWIPAGRVEGKMAHTDAVNGLAWREVPGGGRLQLASVSEDFGVRVYDVEC